MPISFGNPFGSKIDIDELAASSRIIGLVKWEAPNIIFSNTGTTFPAYDHTTNSAQGADSYTLEKARDYISNKIVTDATATWRNAVYYWDLPVTATKLYARFGIYTNLSTNAWCRIHLNTVPAASGFAADRIYCFIDIPAATADHGIRKIVGGATTTIATESVDLSAGVVYDYEILWVGGELIAVWRDKLKLARANSSIGSLAVTETALANMKSFTIQLAMYNANTTGEFRIYMPFVLVVE